MWYLSDSIHIAGLPSHRHLHSEDPLALIFPLSGPSVLSFPVLVPSLPHRLLSLLHLPLTSPRPLACGFSPLSCSASTPDPCFNSGAHSTLACSTLGPAPSTNTFLYNPQCSSIEVNEAITTTQPILKQDKAREYPGETKNFARDSVQKASTFLAEIGMDMLRHLVAF